VVNNSKYYYYVLFPRGVYKKESVNPMNQYKSCLWSHTPNYVIICNPIAYGTILNAINLYMNNGSAYVVKLITITDQRHKTDKFLVILYTNY
jgi:hypothetical protein